MYLNRLHRLLICLGLAFILSPLTGHAGECGAIRTYDRHNPKTKTRVAVVAFQGSNKGLAEDALVATILFREYLSLAERLTPIALMQETTNEKNVNLLADYVIRGKLSPASGETVIELSLAAGEVKKLQASFRSSDDPSSLNEAVVRLAMAASEILKAGLSEKKILPFLNTSSSRAAVREYARGMALLAGSDRLDPRRAEEAVQAFERAIQADYNYVPAYRGLAEARAVLSVMERVGTIPAAGNAQKAQVALVKGQLLNPHVTNLRKRAIEWYLKVKTCE